jgi:hypothetical protein
LEKGEQGCRDPITGRKTMEEEEKEERKKGRKKK